MIVAIDGKLADMGAMPSLLFGELSFVAKFAGALRCRVACCKLTNVPVMNSKRLALD
jgi:hypothetical protein